MVASRLLYEFEALLKFLLTNDDGIDAPGLAALASAAAQLGQTVVLAPHVHVSGCSHQATTHRPLTLTAVGPDRHMLDGSPVDCTRVGVTHLAPEVDWILSGVNEGGNLGADVFLSGTVAAAREACLLGKPAIAFSQYRKREEIDWERAAEWVLATLRLLLDKRPPPGRFWNVNFPLPPAAGTSPDTVFCRLDPHSLPVKFELAEGKLRYAGNYHARERTPGHDVDVCFGGGIAVTEMSLAPASPEC